MSTARSNIHGAKVILCIWWDQLDVVYYELLKPSETITANICLEEVNDVAPSDYYLFRPMAHGLANQHFHSYEEVNKWIDSWIASKDASFFSRLYPSIPRKIEKSSG